VLEAAGQLVVGAAALGCVLSILVLRSVPQGARYLLLYHLKVAPEQRDRQHCLPGPWKRKVPCLLLKLMVGSESALLGNACNELYLSIVVRGMSDGIVTGVWHSAANSHQH